jgi:hypothetical protein
LASLDLSASSHVVSLASLFFVLVPFLLLDKKRYLLITHTTVLGRRYSHHHQLIP